MLNGSQIVDSTISYLDQLKAIAIWETSEAKNTSLFFHTVAEDFVIVILKPNENLVIVYIIHVAYS